MKEFLFFLKEEKEWQAYRKIGQRIVPTIHIERRASGS